MTYRRKFSEPVQESDPRDYDRRKEEAGELRFALPGITDGQIAMLQTRFPVGHLRNLLDHCAERGWNGYALERLIEALTEREGSQKITLQTGAQMDGAPLYTSRVPQRTPFQPAGPFAPPPHGNLGADFMETIRLAEMRYRALAAHA